jgi:hypothetical protein
MNRERLPRVAELELDRVGAFLIDVEPHRGGKGHAAQEVGASRIRLELEVADHFAQHVPARILDPCRGSVAFAAAEFFRETDETDGDHDLDARGKLRQPERVDPATDDRCQVVVHLDVPTGNDPVDVHGTVISG